MSKLKIAVLVSGGGTNLQAIIDKIASGEITNTEIALVFSNNRKAYALERAKMAGIPAKALSPKQFENREAFNDAVLEVIEESKADLIVLAGCLMYIPPKLIEKYHPDLVMNLALPYTNIPIMEACIATHTHYLDTACAEVREKAGFEYGTQWVYHERFKKYFQKKIEIVNKKNLTTTVCLKIKNSYILAEPRIKS